MSESGFAPAWEFLQNASGFKDLEALQEAFARAIAAFGFDRFSCTLISEPGKSPSPRVLFGRSNKAWDEYYLSQGYLKYDACVRQIFSQPGPFTWSDIRDRDMGREARSIFEESAEAGAREAAYSPPGRFVRAPACADVIRFFWPAWKLLSNMA
jgi:hypothetical protein